MISDMFIVEVFVALAISIGAVIAAVVIYEVWDRVKEKP